MTQKVSIPRGTNDILPEDVPKWEYLEHISRCILLTYGYQEIRTPAFEDVGLFKRSLGESSEVVNKQLLELKSSKEDGFALRPEGTAPIVRSYIENRPDKRSQISKLFYMGPMFRGERPQKGRLRQFHQIGAEVIGPGNFNPLVDAEVIALSANLLKGYGLEDFTIHLNSLGTPEDKTNFAQWLREALKDKIKGLNEDVQSQYERNVFRILDSKDKDVQKVVASLNITDEHLSAESREYFQKVQDALKLLDVPFTVSPHLVRGLDYYTQTVFEITCKGLGSQDAVGAGGRYNNLVHQLGGDTKIDYGCCGFALGMERILIALGNGATELLNPLDAYIIVLDEAYQNDAFQILNNLRQNEISADFNFMGGSMKSQMRQANKSGAEFVLILGEDEFKAKKMMVKNLESGDQELVAWDQLVNYFNEIERQ